MVIIKGDFNYRRVFRDTIWPDGTEPAAALGFSPSYPVLLLRTMKSDCLVGVKGETNRHLDETEPGWRTAGKRGVIQLV
jgi:damage-control phosphatase, subfamily III